MLLEYSYYGQASLCLVVNDRKSYTRYPRRGDVPRLISACKRQRISMSGRCTTYGSRVQQSGGASVTDALKAGCVMQLLLTAYMRAPRCLFSYETAGHRVVRPIRTCCARCYISMHQFNLTFRSRTNAGTCRCPVVGI